MATIYDNAIQKMYVAYFNRPADPAGLAYWGGVVTAAGGSTAAVSAAFAASAEYKAAYADFSPTGVLRQIYVNLFNDVADAAGLAYWADLVNTGKLSIDKAVTAIADGAQGVHKTTFANKVLVASAFTAAVNTDAEKAAYSGDLANKAAKTFLSTISTDASATAALVPATLDASVAAVVKASVPFTLTSALSTYQAALDAKKAFLVTADGDGVASTSATDASIAAKVTAAELAITNPSATPLVDGDVGLATYTGTSAAVKAAVLADEVALRAKAITTAQTALATAVEASSEVVGLTAAIAAKKAADAAVVAATKADALSNAALNSAETTYETTGSNAAITINADGTVAGLIVATSTSVALAANVTEITNPGIGALLTAIKADLAAAKALADATAAQTKANTTLNLTDIPATAVDELVAVGQAFAVPLAANAKPSLAQIDFETAALAAKVTAATTANIASDVAVVTAETSFETKNPTFKAGAITIDPVTGASADLLVVSGATVALDPLVTEATHPGATALLNAVKADLLANKALKDASDAAAAFKLKVDAFIAADVSNPLSTVQIAAEAALKLAQDSAAVLNAEIAALAAVKATADQLKAVNAAITAAGETFAENDFVAPVTLSGFVAATADKDIYVAGTAAGNVLGFAKGDVLFLGDKFTLVKGALSTGNDAVLEAFAVQNGADTVISLETKAFGSNSSDAEIVITLTGVNVADVTFANGIISI